MPKFEKSAPELVERFSEVLDRVATPDTTRRPMFGYPCACVGGNMATGLFAQSWWVRLPPDRLAAVLASGEARTFEVMPGREMKGHARAAESLRPLWVLHQTWQSSAGRLIRPRQPLAT